MKKLNYVGIDISARKLDVAISVGGQQPTLFQYDNEPGGIKKLIKEITKGGRYARVVMEATGIYSQPLALALDSGPSCEVMVANPKQIKHFGLAEMKRNKNDCVDAKLMVEFAKRMTFKPWQRPSDNVLTLQGMARRISQLKNEIRREKTRLHTMEYKSKANWVAHDLTINIGHLERRVSLMVDKALQIISNDEDLSWRYELMITVKGIGTLSAISILAELMTLPKELEAPKWVAHAGLDPRAYESGSSVHKPKRISKAGNKYLRTALYMPALSAKRHDPNVKAYATRLEARDKKPIQVTVAIMRKLLHCLWGMFHHQMPFDGNRFYRIPESAI